MESGIRATETIRAEIDGNMLHAPNGTPTIAAQKLGKATLTHIAGVPSRE